MDNLFKPAFAPLRRELDQWKLAGQSVAFWLRDDDAIIMTPKFQPLLALQQKYDLPIVIAVIPKIAGVCLANVIRQYSKISVVQHGWSHDNHMNDNKFYSEFSADRMLGEVHNDLQAGKAQLKQLYGKQFVDGFVPPWNHFSAHLLPLLKNYEFISGREHTVCANSPVPSLPAHIDVLRWKGQPRFRGRRRIVREVCAQLKSQCQTGQYQPVGILLHHLDMDKMTWQFLDELMDVLTAHPAADFVDIRDLNLAALRIPDAHRAPRRRKPQLANRIRQKWQEILGDLAIPQPVYAFVTMALLGIIIGHTNILWEAWASDTSSVNMMVQADAGDMP
jgi:hypothetical protein